jgi:hypothetical protein
LPIADCRLPIWKTSGFMDNAVIRKKSAIGNRQSAIGNWQSAIGNQQNVFPVAKKHLP